MGKLEATIAKATADAQVASTSIEELTAAIATNEADLKAATDMRAKEQADFAKNEAEMVEGVRELDGALAKLEAEQAQPASAALIQQKLDTKNVQALLMTLDVVFTKASIASADRSKLLAMVQNHQSS